MNDFDKIIEFDWDKGNIVKNLLKHGISINTIEQAFSNFAVRIPDEKHSKVERRTLLIGKDNANNILSIIYTLKNNKIRPISARRANTFERDLYAKTFKKYSKI